MTARNRPRFAAFLVLVVALSRVLPSPSAQAAEADAGAWTDDFAQAMKRAEAEDRAVLLNFTGSDWCVWCHRLRDEVFVQPAFIDFAASALVLVEVDFPRRKTLAREVVAQNQQLDDRFNVTGYPTIILLDSGGEEIGRLSYMEGGAKTFVRELKRFIAAANRRGSAQHAEG